jgi:hypothetical protein
MRVTPAEVLRAAGIVSSMSSKANCWSGTEPVDTLG